MESRLSSHSLCCYRCFWYPCVIHDMLPPFEKAVHSLVNRSFSMCLVHVFFGAGCWTLRKADDSHHMNLCGSWLAFILQMWPNYCCQYFWICSLTHGCLSHHIQIVLLQCGSWRETPKTYFKPHIWKTSSLFLSNVSKIHVSDPYQKTGRIKVPPFLLYSNSRYLNFWIWIQHLWQYNQQTGCVHYYY